MKKLLFILLVLAALLVAYFDAPPLAPLMAKAPPAVPRALGAVRHAFVADIFPAARRAWGWTWPKAQEGVAWLVHEVSAAFQGAEKKVEAASHEPAREPSHEPAAPAHP